MPLSAQNTLSQGWRPGGFDSRIPGMFYSPAAPPPPRQLRTQSRPPVLSLGRRVKLDLSPSGAEQEAWRVAGAATTHSIPPPARVTKTTVPSGPRELWMSRRQGPAAARGCSFSRARAQPSFSPPRYRRLLAAAASP